MRRGARFCMRLSRPDALTYCSLANDTEPCGNENCASITIQYDLGEHARNAARYGARIDEVTFGDRTLHS